MFKFEKKQEVFDIYGVKSDEKKGIFDKEKAETLLNTMDEMTDKTGNPNIVQIFGATSDAIVKYIDFVTSISESPFLIDSTSAQARIAGSKYVTESGLAERTIYNSINMSIDNEEIDTLINSDITSSIILGFNPTQPGVDGKIKLWDDGAGVLDKGLLEIADDCGIIKPLMDVAVTRLSSRVPVPPPTALFLRASMATRRLMDVAVTPLGQGGGSAVKTTFKEKSIWGYPAGSGIHNVPSAWEWIKQYKKEYPEVWPVCDIGANIVQQMVGGDFVLFGPIENTRKAFTACAMTDKAIGINAVDSHPYKNLL